MRRDNSASKTETWSTSTRCAACKIRRKKCSEKCVLWPYFPQNNPQKFLLVYTVFGNGHVLKILQSIPTEKRDDAVSSMVYEASERIRDPVHGCVGVINQLKKKLSELESQLASTQAKVANITQQYDNLLATITGNNEVFDPNFYGAPLAESELKYSPASDDVEPMQLNDEDPMQLWESFLA